MDLRDQLQAALGSGYVIDRELGGGGMSRVFVAEETALGRQVVVKVLPPELSAEVSSERFRREVQLAARLHHPHIVPLLSAGEGGGLVFYTMPLIDGESLRERLARAGELPVGETVRFLRDVIDALCYAHERGVVHRDLKPDNVLVSRHHALVTDFGIAKALRAATDYGSVTSVGIALGTPSYMAPEQAAADPATNHRADLYSVGVMAYELLTGRTPFSGLSPQAMLAAHATVAPEPVTSYRPAVPAALAALVMCCLEKHPADRPQTAEEVLRELETLAVTSGSRALASHGARVVAPGTGGARRGVPRGPPLRRAVAFAGLTLLLGLGGYHSLSLIGGPASAGDGSQAPRRSGLDGAAAAKSVAVLPFLNISADPENEYFSDGITEELINGLMRVEGLRVASRTSAFAFKGRNEDIREIGAKLGVGTVLAGSVRKAGTRLRISAQLIDVAADSALWSETYERELEDVFAVQDEISRAIVGSLRLRLDLRGGAPVVTQHTSSVSAYDLYLRGRFFFNRFTEPDLRKSIELYEEALAEDPKFALPWAGIAETWSSLADDWLPPKEAYPKAKAAAINALVLDSTLAQAHAALGTVLMAYEWDFAGAERAFRRALALTPNDPLAHAYVSTVLVRTTGREQPALAEIQKAIELDPMNVRYVAGLAGTLVWLRRYDEALEAGRRALALDPGVGGLYIVMGEAYLANEMPADALLMFQRAQELGYVRSPEAIARAFAALGRHDESRRIVEDLERVVLSRYVRPEYMARVYVSLGDKEKAFAWLDSAYAARSAGLTWLKVHPGYDPLRADPRFTRLMTKVGLAAR
ncbi:MAG: tetratricopeptide repeat-containing serine/threonine-protein kinase [Gemmatimonadota bacterium]|nr:tetratricopeptide repeat-containing serine/threonine-protein kinase [Gemmatimonadota bacterium]